MAILYLKKQIPLLQYVAGILMALSLSDKGYSALNIQVPSFKDLVYITRISGPLLLTMISKVRTSEKKKNSG